MTAPATIDPITLEVVRNKLEGIAQRDADDAAAQRVLADREGRDGLLGRALHRGRPDHRAGHRHPDPSRHHDPRARGRRGELPDRRDGRRRRLSAERSLLRRHAPAGHHALHSGVRGGACRGLQRRDGPPPGRGRHGAGLDPHERDRDLPGGAAPSAAEVHRGREGQRDAGSESCTTTSACRRPSRAT